MYTLISNMSSVAIGFDDELIVKHFDPADFEKKEVKRNCYGKATTGKLLQFNVHNLVECRSHKISI